MMRDGIICAVRSLRWPCGRSLAFPGMLFFLAAAPLFAQESESSPADSPTGQFFRWLNFAIVFGVIAYFAVKKGGPYFRGQAEEISPKIAEGARAREAAEEQRRQVEAKMANLEKEIAEMRAEAKKMPRPKRSDCARRRARTPKKSNAPHRRRLRLPSALLAWS